MLLVVFVFSSFVGTVVVVVVDDVVWDDGEGDFGNAGGRETFLLRVEV